LPFSQIPSEREENLNRLGNGSQRGEEHAAIYSALKQRSFGLRPAIFGSPARLTSVAFAHTDEISGFLGAHPATQNVPINIRSKALISIRT
jgi:hypothetical protein